MGVRTDIDDEERSGHPGAKRYWGKYVGFVRDNNDPERRGRVRFYCPEVMGDRDHEENWTPFALPCWDGAGGFNSGKLQIPPQPADSQRGTVDSGLSQWACWIEFRHGDPRLPIYVGGFYVGDKDLPDFIPRLGDGNLTPREPSVGPPVGSSTIRVRTITVDSATNTVSTATTEAEEPPAAADPVYPHNRVYRSPSGHVAEMDDSPGDERVRVYHRRGTFWEMTEDGSLVTKIVGRRFGFVSEDDIDNIVGRRLLLSAERVEQVSGSDELIVDGPRTAVIGGPEKRWNLNSFARTVTGLYVVGAGNVELTSTEAMKLQAAGGLSLGAGERLDAVSLRVAIVGAAMASIGCPGGVVIHGLAPAEAAAGFLYDSTTLELTIGAAYGAYQLAKNNAALAAEIATMPNFVLALEGLFAGIIAAFPAAHTQHRISR